MTMTPVYSLTDKNTDAGCGTVKGGAPRAKKSSARQPRIGHSSRRVSTVDGQLGMATISKPLSLNHWKTWWRRMCDSKVQTRVRNFFKKKSKRLKYMTRPIVTHAERIPVEFSSTENVNHHISERMIRFTRPSKLRLDTLDLSKWLRPFCWCAQSRHRGAEQKEKSNTSANTVDSGEVVLGFWGSQRRRSKPPHPLYVVGGQHNATRCDDGSEG